MQFNDNEDLFAFTPRPPAPPTPGSKIAEDLFYATFDRAVNLDAYALLWAARHLVDPSQEDSVDVDDMLTLARALKTGNINPEPMVVYPMTKEEYDAFMENGRDVPAKDDEAE